MKNKVRAIKGWLGFCLFCLVLLMPITSFSLPGTTGKMSREDAAAKELAKTIEQVKDETLPLEDREFALQQLAGLPTAKRLALLREFVAIKNEGIATGVMQALIQQGDFKAKPIIEARMVSLFPANQAAVLDTVLSKRTLHLQAFDLLLARECLQRMILSPAIVDGKNYDERLAPNAAGAAALILANANSLQDKQSIRDALQKFPRTSTLWLSLALMQGVSDAEVTLGQSVFANVKTDSGTRADVAIAIAPFNKAAALYVVNRVKQLLSKYGNNNPFDIDPTKWDNKTFEAMDELGIELILVSHLRFLNTPEAEQLVFRCVNVSNSHIRNAAALVAASRYPEKLMAWIGQRGRTGLKSVERENLLAFVAIGHSELEPQVKAKLKNYQVIVDRLRRDGIIKSFLTGDAFLGL